MPTELQAHRGFADEHPENTLRAVREAVTCADRVEVDVRRCGSGELVVFHDDALSRLTDAHGLVADAPWSELRGLEVLGSGETIPRLSDVVDAVRDGVGLNVELKHAGIADRVLAATDDAAGVVFSSFHRRALAELRDRDPDAMLAYVSDRGPNCVDTAVDLGCSFVHPAKELCDRAFVDRAHAAGLGVNAWTVTTHEETAALQAAGVDGVIADSPAVL